MIWDRVKKSTKALLKALKKKFKGKDRELPALRVLGPGDQLPDSGKVKLLGPGSAETAVILTIDSPVINADVINPSDSDILNLSKQLDFNLSKQFDFNLKQFMSNPKRPPSPSPLDLYQSMWPWPADRTTERYTDYATGTNRSDAQVAQERRVAELEAALRSQADFLSKLKAAAHTIATVVEVRGPRMTISTGTLIDVATFAGAKPGDTVCCSTESMQVISIMRTGSPAGVLAKVKTVLSPTQIEIESSGIGEGRTVIIPEGITVLEGDRVITDTTQTIVMANLGKPKSVLAWEQPTHISWDDIGGHVEAKKALIDAIETPVKHPELFELYGRKPSKGVLLYGPPGTGKTLLAKAAATALARIHGRDVAQGFIYVKGPEILSKWVGESESSVRALFTAAREHKKTHGYPAVVFIDEADAILGKRGGSRGMLTQTLVPQFLAEMDGLADAGCFLLLATNRPEDLDPAVTREGRIDRKVRIGRPTPEDTKNIARIHLRNRPFQADSSVDDLAEYVSTMMHSHPIGAVVGPNGAVPIHLSAFASGAMIAGICEEAATSALTRDVEAGTGGISGLGKEDVRNGITKTVEGLMALDHSDILNEIVASNPSIFTGETPAKVDLHKTDTLSN